MMIPWRFLVLMLSLLLFWSVGAQAGDFHDLYRGSRSQAMGGTGVGLADDEQMVFMNPAGLAGNKRYTFHYAVVDLTSSSESVTATAELAEALSSPSGEALNAILGKNIYGQAQLTSNVVAIPLSVFFMLSILF